MNALTVAMSVTFMLMGSVASPALSASPHSGASGLAGAVPVEVRVHRMSPTGAMAPAAGVEVLVERWASSPARMGEAVIEALYRAETDTQGRATFPPELAAGGAEVIASVIEQGVTFRASSSPRSPGGMIDLRLYDQSGTRDELEGLMQVDLSIRDGFVIVETAWTLRTTGRRLVPLEEGNGLRVPVALPAVFGDALDAGLLPPETARRHLALQVSPQTGRLVVRQGAVFFEGHVPPGPGTQIRVRYALPIVAERMDLALRAPIELAAFSMSSEWTDKISPRIVPSKPYRAHRRVRADSVQQLMRLRDPVKAGEPIVLHVSRLPRPLEVHGAVALGGSLFLLFISLLALTAGWRRER